MLMERVFAFKLRQPAGEAASFAMPSRMPESMHTPGPADAGTKFRTAKSFIRNCWAIIFIVLIFIPGSMAATDDFDKCMQEGEIGISDCTSAITSGRYSKQNLALLYVLRGIKYYSKGDYDNALADYNAALKVDKNSGLAYYARGLLRIGTSDYGKALEDVNAAIELRHDDDKLLAARCQIYLLQNQLRNAISDCNEAIQLNPKNATAFGLRGPAKGR
jgi:tetratricopeptide (TPR) repeat protein